MRIEVRNNAVDKALRVLTKKLRADGWRSDVARHRHHMTRSQRERLKHDKAVRRQRKAEAKRAALA